jgi:uncharacterized protein with HEPN domain
MTEKEIKYLSYILQAIELIEEFTTNLSGYWLNKTKFILFIHSNLMSNQFIFP